MVNPKIVPIGTSKRVTIMLDTPLDKQIREIQASRIKNELGSVSFSNVVNEIVKLGLLAKRRSQWRQNSKAVK